MGIEGFVEAIALETAPFGVAFTLVEPGPTRTGLDDGLSVAPALTVYRNTPAGEMRHARETGAFNWTFDEPGWMVDAMIASAEHTPAPRPLTLGAGPYKRVRQSLTEPLAALEAQKEVACGEAVAELR